MAVADIELGVGPTIAGELHEKVGRIGLFCFLAAFTLFTLDGGDLAPRIISAVFLLAAAIHFSYPRVQSLSLNLPAVLLLLMTGWGITQTLWSAQRIVYNGWNGVLFWFTVSAMVLVATQVFRDARGAADFRLALVVFGSAVCLLDLLERATRTSHYYWLIPSRYHAVFGPFAYWNNFAQFVEIVLPVTLWQGLARVTPDITYLLLAALQVCAVVASGSRAGTFLVIGELLVAVGLACFRYRNKKLLLGAAAAIVLTIVFIYAAGFETVLAKLQRDDQLGVRQHINEASLAMIRERPLTGWGLDNYVSAYRMFALYDDGTYVNRAHNDWLQFAAEGGVFFAGAMLVIFVWSIPRAIRSGWGIGLIAICLHAAVDYPFARIGVCGWYFALLAMLARQDGSWRTSSARSMQQGEYSVEDNS